MSFKEDSNHHRWTGTERRILEFLDEVRTRKLMTRRDWCRLNTRDRFHLTQQMIHTERLRLEENPCHAARRHEVSTLLAKAWAAPRGPAVMHDLAA